MLLADAHDLIGVTALRNDPEFTGIDGTDLSVVVIDTGTDVTHPLIAPNYLTDGSGELVGKDFVNPSNGTNPVPVADHGTHVSGIIGATDPNIGIAPNVNLIGLQVFDPASPGQRPTASLSKIEDALQWVIEHRAEHNIVAVNMSLGGGLFLTPEQAANSPLLDEIDTLEQHGVAVVSAAGNDFDLISHIRRLDGSVPLNLTSSPGILSTFNVCAVYEGNDEPALGGFTIVVDADRDGTPEFIYSKDFDPDADQLTFFSQRPDPGLDSTICAPGADITSTIPEGELADFAGTSMAAPMISGSVALLQQVALQFGGQLLPVPQLQQFVMETADTIIDNAEDTQFISTLIGDPDANMGPQQMLLTGQTFRRINVHAAAERIVDFFAGLDDPNGTIGTASPGREVFVVNGALSPIGQLRYEESQRPILADIGNDGDRPVGARDVDMYGISVLSTGTLTIETFDRTPSNSTDDADTVVRLFDAAGNELIADDDSNGDGFSLAVVQSLPAGDYFVGVSGAPNDSYDATSLGTGVNGDTGKYGLRFQLESVDVNGTIDSATDLGVVSEAGTVFTDGIGYDDASDSYEAADIVDMFRIEVSERGQVAFDIDTFDVVQRGGGDFRNPLYDSGHNRRTPNPNHDLYLRIFDSLGNELDFNDDGFSTAFGADPAEVPGQEYIGWSFFDGTEPSGALSNLGELRAQAHGRILDSFLELELDGGTYFIGVSTAAQHNYDPNSLNSRPANASAAIRYDLTAYIVPRDEDGSIPRATARPTVNAAINSPQNFAAEIGSDAAALVGAEDVDMWRIVPTSDGTLDVDVNTTSGGVDSYVTLFDASGNRLGSNDSDGESIDARLVIPVVAGQAYFVAVSGAGNTDFDANEAGSGTPGDTGEYSLTINLNSASEPLCINDNTAADCVRPIAIDELASETVGTDNGVIRGAADIDIFQFQASSTNEVTFATHSTSPFSANTFLRLFHDDNGDLVEVAQNDNASALRLNSSITYIVQAGQTYYIAVNGSSESADSYDPATGAGAADGSMGTYLLEVSVASCNTLVTNTDDSGAGSLREAILCANTIAGTDTISFDIPGGGPHTIALTSALPPITAAVVIDGTTQGGYAETPLIELDGSLAGAGSNGLRINVSGGGSTIRGLAINGFDADGIFSRGSNLTIQENHVGTNPAGTSGRGNGNAGVHFINTHNNTVRDNVISDNEFGVIIEGGGATGNVIASNKIGTDAGGTLDLGNRFEGVLLGSPGNTIGGVMPADRNIIAGNKFGIQLATANANGNFIQGNFIGVDASGNAALGGGSRGVILKDADSNTIGGAGDAGNVISGKTFGIFILRGENNLIHGNFIGTNAAGDATLGNTRGIVIRDAVGNEIGNEPNVISGNVREGVKIFDSESTGNTVQHNFIGTNAAGDAALPNRTGVLISNEAEGNAVGGMTAAERNVISGNSEAGIELNANNNIVQGNWIGINVTGDAAIGNRFGVLLRGGAAGNTTGGAAAGAGNVISGNSDYGLWYEMTSGVGNDLFGNWIGTDGTGSSAVGNQNGVLIETTGNTIGGAGAGEGNVVSGNTKSGIVLSGDAATGVSIQGNRIGTNLAGTTAVPNATGILIDEAPGNTVGGTAVGAGNSIAGNTQQGVKISGAGAAGNLVQGNSIGLDGETSSVIPNRDGVRITDEASNNTIGGTAVGEGNEIAHNIARGVWITGGTGNKVVGNSIHDNGGFGIQLSGDGNNLQNAPALSSAIGSGGNVTVTGTLHSTPNTAFTIEFYSSTTADPSGFGEGETFINPPLEVTTDSNGNLSFSPTLSVSVPIGHVITATATDAACNTSEFSNGVTVSATLRAADGERNGGSARGLTHPALTPIVDAAVDRLSAAGFTPDSFANVEFAIADLPGATLGLATGNSITLDVNAAGHGWFVDITPRDDSEFSNPQSAFHNPQSMDLLTVVMHELGHIAGLEDLSDSAFEDDLMYGWLEAGVRKTSLEATLVDEVFSHV